MVVLDAVVADSGLVVVWEEEDVVVVVVVEVVAVDLVGKWDLSVWLPLFVFSTCIHNTRALILFGLQISPITSHATGTITVTMDKVLSVLLRRMTPRLSPMLLPRPRLLMTTTMP
jgi:hypothetical protein